MPWNNDRRKIPKFNWYNDYNFISEHLHQHKVQKLSRIAHQFHTTLPVPDTANKLRVLTCLIYSLDAYRWRLHFLALTSLSWSVMDDVLSWGTIAAMTGRAEYIAGGQDFTADRRSLCDDGIVARATRAT